MPAVRVQIVFERPFPGRRTVRKRTSAVHKRIDAILRR
jgi:hypothetical protein